MSDQHHNPQIPNEPPGDLVEPDNPAAWALARHIADYPVSVFQAAMRYLGGRVDFELHEVEPDPDAAGQSRTTPDDDAGGGDAADNLAQSGVITPGCDCGHDGMGADWHARDCAWRDQPSGPNLEFEAETASQVEDDGPVATPRNAPDLRYQLASVFKAKGGKLPTWTHGGADTIGALVDELLAVVDAALPDRAQAAIRAAAARVQVRDRQLAAVRAALTKIQRGAKLNCSPITPDEGFNNGARWAVDYIRGALDKPAEAPNA